MNCKWEKELSVMEFICTKPGCKFEGPEYGERCRPIENDPDDDCFEKSEATDE